ncbi:MAG: aspartate carbamoyltransferase regulatory subunit [Clostridia bacterium]|nr:aspartate carbamoyltransferase regulatory subunit [Clostridia bacterium]
MHIDSIKEGIVIDHITAGNAMRIYSLLGFDKLECSIAIIKNVTSKKMGKKDIIKIDSNIEINLEALGYIDPGITIDVIRDSKLVEKRKVSLPEKLTNVIKCKNPRCITSVEQELPHIFKKTDNGEKAVYRCIYCETKAE